MVHQKKHIRISKYGRRFVAGKGQVRYQIWVRPEGEEFYKPTSIVYKSKIKATTFANIETVAGMGEDYEVRKIKIRS